MRYPKLLLAVLQLPRRFVETRTTGLAVDEALNLLSNERRRLVLRRVAEVGETNLKALATEIAAREVDSPTDAISSKERKRVYTSCLQLHLPKLASADALLFDRSSGDVRSVERTVALVALLDDIERHTVDET